MAGRSVLKVSVALWNAFPETLRDLSTDEARRIIIAAAYLDLLSEKFGLSELYEDQLQQRSHRPSSFLPFVSHYLPVTEGPFDTEDLRDRLYTVLAGLVESEDLHMAGRPDLTGSRLLTTAQIYWALSHDKKTRPDLVFKGGPVGEGRDRHGRPTDLRAVIWVPTKDGGKDAAAVPRTPRADIMNHAGGTSGSGLRAEGALIAVLAARHIIANNRQHQPSVDGLNFHFESIASGGHRVSSISWDLQQRPRANDDVAAGDALRIASGGDPTLHTLQQLRRKAATGGQLGEAAILCNTVISILQARSEADAGNHETQLSEAYLQGGLTSMLAGGIDEALGHFTKAKQASQMLADLRPDEPTHKVRLAVALTMLGQLFMQLGRIQDAEAALQNAVALSQEITDHDTNNEDMLVVALTAQGLLYVQTSREEDAMTALTRSVTIAEKLTTRGPGGYANCLQLASTLTALGALYIQIDHGQNADSVLTRAATVAQKLNSQNTDDRATQLLLANIHYLQGALHRSSPRKWCSSFPSM